MKGQLKSSQLLGYPTLTNSEGASTNSNCLSDSKHKNSCQAFNQNSNGIMCLMNKQLSESSKDVAALSGLFAEYKNWQNNENKWKISV